MVQNHIISVVLFMLTLSGCASLQNNAKYDLADGKYKIVVNETKFNCYVENKVDTIVIYYPNTMNSTVLPKKALTHLPLSQKIIKHSLDIDILSALFKVRPNLENSLPPQLNSNFNGNIYVGHRTDIYHVHYKKNQLDYYNQQINHLGFSGGLFVGIGNTAINPSTTNNLILSEYDGIVLQKGIAGIIAVDKLTIGLSIGFDNLLDKNKGSWIYKDKIWYGLMLGLNLN